MDQLYLTLIGMTIYDRELYSLKLDLFTLDFLTIVHTSLVEIDSGLPHQCVLIKRVYLSGKNIEKCYGYLLYVGSVYISSCRSGKTAAKAI